ncbi:MAG: hypothetical protein WCP21_23430, partial [Armatimonadota bacterium]
MTTPAVRSIAPRLPLIPLALAAGLLSLTGQAQSAPTSPPPVRIVASCDFEGPYSTGEQQIHEGLSNNWAFGRKDMLFRAEKNAGRPGTVQAIHTRGMSSGAVQLFYTRIKLKKDRYYRVSVWMRTDGLEAPMLINIRQGGHPWTSYMYKSSRHAYWIGYPETQWKRYMFTGKSDQDVNDDLGVMWEVGSMGSFWLDDLVVEESDQSFEAPVETARPPAGNLLPRSSCEGRRDSLWTTAIGGQWVKGVYLGAQAEWEDPQWFRAQGGKFGQSCMAIPASTYAGAVGTISTLMDVVPGQTYTLSAWLKSDRENFRAGLGAGYYESGGYPFGQEGLIVGREWKRYAVTGVVKPSRYDQVYLQVSLDRGMTNGTLFVDGLQFEAGTNATPYKPRFPIEFYADVGQAGGNLFEWGQKVPLTVLAASADT